MLGARIGSAGGHYFVVMVVRPDLTAGRWDAACQDEVLPPAGLAPEAQALASQAGGAPVVHVAEGIDEE